jgi:hypothetical protein
MGLRSPLAPGPSNQSSVDACRFPLARWRVYTEPEGWRALSKQSEVGAWQTTGSNLAAMLRVTTSRGMAGGVGAALQAWEQEAEHGEHKRPFDCEGTSDLRLTGAEVFWLAARSTL